MLLMRLPEEKDRENVLAYYEEIEKNNSESIGMGNYRDFDRWLTGMRNRHAGKDLPEGFVQEDFCLCYENDKLVGVFSLKFELTDYLLNFGGHIGYAVRPSERNRGLATQILRQGLEMAKNRGFSKVLCVCDDDNIASEKVILKNGGVLEDTRYDPEEHVTVKRYWIIL